MHKKRSREGKAGGSKSNTKGLDLRVIESLLDQLGGRSQTDPLETAQDLIYDAWEARDRRKRSALAKRALKLSPLCADAYALLAREAAQDADEAIDYYRKAVAAGEKAVGKACFRDDVGHFWGILETRPYMRACQGLAQSLWDKGLRDEAVAHYRDMLRLNPNDNQGIRYQLLDCLLFLGRDDEAADLITTYNGDGSGAWSWSRALLAFRRAGDCAESRNALLQARGGNKYVAPLLLGDKKMPRRLPAYISWGDRNEAVAYVHGAAPAWAAASGALVWLRASDAATKRVPFHSALMPAAFIIGHHFSISALWWA
jgi:tetratricopeptide (TPR) repeat protein